MPAATQNLSIEQGSTYTKVLRWEVAPIVFKAIASISNAAPCRVITAVPHGVPDGWRVAIQSAKGLVELNSENAIPSPCEYRQVHVVDSTTLELTGVNALDFGVYTTGGVIQYNTPMNLTGFTGRFQVRTSVTDPTVLYETDTVAGGIIIDVTGATITIQIAATDTANFTWGQGVYNLEMVSSGGQVYRLLEGRVVVRAEVAR